MQGFDFTFGLKRNNESLFVRATAKSKNKGVVPLEKAKTSRFSFGNSFKSRENQPKSQSLFLFSDSYNFDFLKIIPRLFTITTNTGSSNFNTYILRKTSSVIDKFLKENPHHLQYHLDFNDEGNILGKFEKMYQGEFVAFDDDELIFS